MLRPRVLILDQDTVHQRLLSMLGHRVGVVPKVVSNCEGAIKELEQSSTNYSAIFIDLDIPRSVYAIKCLQAIKDFRRTRGLSFAIIALTAYAMESERQECFTAGVDDYLSKPFSVKQFEDMLHRWIDYDHVSNKTA